MSCRVFVLKGKLRVFSGRAARPSRVSANELRRSVVDSTDLGVFCFITAESVDAAHTVANVQTSMLRNFSCRPTPFAVVQPIIDGCAGRRGRVRDRCVGREVWRQEDAVLADHLCGGASVALAEVRRKLTYQNRVSGAA